MDLALELEDTFIDPQEVKKNVIKKLLAKAKYRQDGGMYIWDKRRIAAIEALSLEEINYVCSASTYAI